MLEIIAINSTFTTRGEAVSVARMLIEKRLIACANIMDNVTSIYRWEGRIAEEQEVVLIAKTTAALAQEVVAAIKAVHSHALPCIALWPVTGGFAPFLNWVEEETRTG